MACGIDILKFYQGVVEVTLRSAVAVLGLGALIASSIAVDQTARNIDPLKAARSNELVICTLGAGGEIIGIAAIAIISQIIMIILRFLNVCKGKIKVFLVVNIILSIFLVSGYLAGGISAAYFSAGWAPVPSTDPLEIGKILSSLAATTGFSLLSAIVCTVLAAWLVLFMRKNRNEKAEKLEGVQLQS